MNVSMVVDTFTGFFISEMCRREFNMILGYSDYHVRCLCSDGRKTHELLFDYFRSINSIDN